MYAFVFSFLKRFVGMGMCCGMVMAGFVGVVLLCVFAYIGVHGLIDNDCCSAVSFLSGSCCDVLYLSCLASSLLVLVL
jgi:hypothetical protein